MFSQSQVLANGYSLSSDYGICNLIIKQLSFFFLDIIFSSSDATSPCIFERIPYP
uniref:Uncharacterized protein n=1 Tax=Manihot esculenta TaxID=3983 RepID=A0A2C9UM08_MANES